MSEAKTHKVTLIPGDGIGPEVTQAVVRILELRARSSSGSALPPGPRPSRFTASTFLWRCTSPSSATAWR